MTPATVIGWALAALVVIAVVLIVVRLVGV